MAQKNVVWTLVLDSYCCSKFHTHRSVVVVPEEKDHSIPKSCEYKQYKKNEMHLKKAHLQYSRRQFHAARWALKRLHTTRRRRIGKRRLAGCHMLIQCCCQVPHLEGKVSSWNLFDTFTETQSAWAVENDGISEALKTIGNIILRWDYAFEQSKGKQDRVGSTCWWKEVDTCTTSPPL